MSNAKRISKAAARRNLNALYREIGVLQLAREAHGFDAARESAIASKREEARLLALSIEGPMTEQIDSSFR